MYVRLTVAVMMLKIMIRYDYDVKNHYSVV